MNNSGPGGQRVRLWEGDRDQTASPTSAVVCGGGLAGLAAATILCERGVSVTVLESESSLGGRLRTWPETLPDGSITVRDANGKVIEHRRPDEIGKLFALGA